MVQERLLILFEQGSPRATVEPDITIALALTDAELSYDQLRAGRPAHPAASVRSRPQPFCGMLARLPWRRGASAGTCSPKIS